MHPLCHTRCQTHSNDRVEVIIGPRLIPENGPSQSPSEQRVFHQFLAPFPPQQFTEPLQFGTLVKSRKAHLTTKFLPGVPFRKVLLNVDFHSCGCRADYRGSQGVMQGISLLWD
jgi:hypothetical protein